MKALQSQFLLCVLAAAVCLSQTSCSRKPSEDQLPLDEAWRSSGKGGVSYSARYGSRTGELRWVIFESTVSEFRYPPEKRPVPDGYLKIPAQEIVLPDGIRTNISNSRMMFQFQTSKEYKVRPINVTLAQLTNFLAKADGEYSFEALDAFLTNP